MLDKEKERAKQLQAKLADLQKSQWDANDSANVSTEPLRLESDETDCDASLTERTPKKARVDLRQSLTKQPTSSRSPINSNDDNISENDERISMSGFRYESTPLRVNSATSRFEKQVIKYKYLL